MDAIRRALEPAGVSSRTIEKIAAGLPLSAKSNG